MSWNIYYSLDNGVTWNSSHSNIPTTASSTSWTPDIPTLSSDSVLLSIVSTIDNDIRDVSNESLTLIKPNAIDIVQPNGGEVLSIGSPYIIEYSISGNVPSVQLSYSINNGSSWSNITITGVTAGTNYYNWTVPNNPTSNALIRIRQVTGLSISAVSDSVFSIEEADDIDLIYPDGGEIFNEGDIVNITWSASGISNVIVQWSPDFGATINEIVASVPASSGTWAWTVPSSPSHKGQVRIADASASGTTVDASSTQFDIVPSATLDISYPNGGENFVIGNDYSILWNMSGLTGDVDLYYSIDAGNTWIEIDTDISAVSGTYNWTVTSTSSSISLVKVVSSDFPSISGTSNSYFTIGNPSSITIINPVGGESFTFDDNVSIQWSVSSITSVTIDYSINNKSSWSTIATGVPASSGTYNWIVPSAGTEFGFIRVSDDSSTASAESNQFSITSETEIVVTHPVASQTVLAGKFLDINWNASGLSAIDIDYSLNGGGAWNNIAQTVDASSGTWHWNIPTTTSNQALIRVYDSTTGSLSGYISLGTTSLTSNFDGNVYDTNWWAFYNVQSLTGSGSAVTGYTLSGNALYWRFGSSWTNQEYWNKFFTTKYPSTSSSNMDIQSRIWRINSVNGSLSESLGIYGSTGNNASIESEWFYGNIRLKATFGGVDIMDYVTGFSNGDSNKVYRLVYDRVTESLIYMYKSSSADLSWTTLTTLTASFGTNQLYAGVGAKIFNANVGSQSVVADDIGITYTPISGTTASTANYTIGYSGLFNIQNPYVNLINPVGGEYFQVGGSTDINWSSSGLSNVTIQYSIDNKSSWTTLTTLTSTSGTFNWLIPNQPTNFGFVKVYGSVSSSISSTHISPFNILSSTSVLISTVEGESTKLSTFGQDELVEKTAELQRSVFKALSPNDIRLQHIPEEFSYSIGYGQTDFSLTSFCNAYVVDLDNSAYYGIQRKFYEEQSVTSDDGLTRIIPSSVVSNNIGTVTANKLLIFSFVNAISKDGISNINPEKNIILNLRSVAHDGSTTIGYGYGDSRAIPYTLYDRKISSTAGDVMMKILQPSSTGELVSNGTLLADFRYDSDLVVGKIFYDYSLIVIDSFQKVQRSSWSLSATTYYHYIPYPVQNFPGSVEPQYETSGEGYVNLISHDFENIIFNKPSVTGSQSLYNVDYYNIATYSTIFYDGYQFISSFNPENSIIVDDVDVTFVINKNTYIIDVPVFKNDFNYSANRFRISDGENVIAEATEENPIWFNKIGFYDYKNNLLGIARLNLPLKKSNKRTMVIKVKVDY